MFGQSIPQCLRGESHGRFSQSVKPSRPRPEDRQVGNGGLEGVDGVCVCFPHDLLRCLHQTTRSLSLSLEPFKILKSTILFAVFTILLRDIERILES